jgi:SAM-dependent methyltransferase
VSGFKDHFSERAAGYAVYRPHYPAELAAWLASAAPARRLAWDAGCGSGQLSTLLGDHFEKVIATDASSAQIERAVAHPRVEYRVEPAESSTLAAGSADLITVAQAAHWMKLDAFYREARRVASDGALIALVAYERTRIDPAVDPIIERFYAGDLDRWWPPERKHIETGYRTLGFPFEPIAAPPFEMKATWTADQLVGYIRTWSAVRAMEAATGPEATNRFEESVRGVWGPDAREITWPMVVLAGRIFPKS